MDVDVYANYEYTVKKEFQRLLEKENKFLDEFSDEIWMPEETEYLDFFSGRNFNAYIAKEEYVLISKALKAPDKNKLLVMEYISKGADKLFWELAKKYKLKTGDFT
jgi:hypothetical protein